jgi:hypothetical protein
MLAHDTAWFMASPFPEVAVRNVPTQRVESVRHVVETDLEVVLAHPALGGLQEEARFATEFRDHMIFRAADRGRVIIENLFGDPVYVVGDLGQGRDRFQRLLLRLYGRSGLGRAAVLSRLSEVAVRRVKRAAPRRRDRATGEVGIP